MFFLGELVKMKDEKAERENELEAAKAQLASLRRRAADVDPLAARLKVDATDLKKALAAHFTSSLIDSAPEAPSLGPPPKMV